MHGVLDATSRRAVLPDSGVSRVTRAFMYRMCQPFYKHSSSEIIVLCFYFTSKLLVSRVFVATMCIECDACRMRVSDETRAFGSTTCRLRSCICCDTSPGSPFATAILVFHY